jgi:dephospho-CoA kinase
VDIQILRCRKLDGFIKHHQTPSIPKSFFSFSTAPKTCLVTSVVSDIQKTIIEIIHKMSISIILSHFSTLFLIPAGVVIGALTERIATRNIFLVPGKLFNTALKLTVASFLWTHFVSMQPLDGGGTTCILPSSTIFLYGISLNIDDYDLCSPTQGIKIIIHLVLKCLILYVSIRFGVSMQPVGITGGIACGKSTVTKLFRDSSQSNKKDAFAVIDVDAIAHDILVPGKMKEDCAYHRIVSTFEGEDILEKKDNDNDKGIQSNPAQIDRRKLGDIIFRDHAKRRKLNSITHPLISKIMMKQIIREDFSPSSNDTSIVAVDIPLLFEVGLKMKALFAIKVVVACSSEVQLERLIDRNPDLTVEQCTKRIESQIPVYKKVEMADIVIWNNGTMDDLIKEVEIARENIVCRKHSFMGITLARLMALYGIITTLLCAYDIVQLW